jgi:hypothetical protein
LLKAFLKFSLSKNELNFKRRIFLDIRKTENYVRCLIRFPCVITEKFSARKKKLFRSHTKESSSSQMIISFCEKREARHWMDAIVGNYLKILYETSATSSNIFLVRVEIVKELNGDVVAEIISLCYSSLETQLKSFFFVIVSFCE